MLCEKCQKNEAVIKITKVVNNISETHNLCQECASSFSMNEKGQPDWRMNIFKLLSDAVRDQLKETKPDEPDEKLKDMTCPTCLKTYGEFLEDGCFGCADCYEAFAPSVDATIRSIQGADSHMGKRPFVAKAPKTPAGRDIVKAKLSTEEEIELLTHKMNEAVAVEDYSAAAALRDKIRELQKEDGNE